MPSHTTGGRGRSAIRKWRVKAGKRDVFTHEKKGECERWLREHASEYQGLRLVPPNGKK